MTIENAAEAINAEITALSIARDSLDGSFPAALEAIMACSGRVIVSGMGKAGLIGQKIAASLAGEALEIMRENRISDIPVLDAEGVVVGMADLKGLVAS
ncbi:MAG: hypothetical protein LBU23_12765, partial [Planctomycetota bacterium]|nr:hypothetical protein [Planctomycetota bacterium]